MARGVRQRCPASGFLFAMAFDLFFDDFKNAIIPRNPAGLDFLQPLECAHADDLAVAASSILDLMTALAPAFHSVDHIAGLNLNYRKCCWVQYGSEDVNHYYICCQITVRIFAKCRLSDMPSTWAP